VVCGVGEIEGVVAVIIAQERRRGKEPVKGIYPEGFRKAQRAMEMAAKFMLPIVTLIDTTGASPGLEAEERGLGNAIAQCLATLSDLPTPIISVIIGEGGSEGALAFGVADRILMMENAIFSVMPPERAAALLYRDASRAEEIAPALKLTAEDCEGLGVVDVIVPEPKGGAHVSPDDAARQLKRVLLEELADLQGGNINRLIKARYEKFRGMGRYSSRISVAMVRERGKLQEFLMRRLGGLIAYLPIGTKEGSAEAEPIAELEEGKGEKDSPEDLIP